MAGSEISRDTRGVLQRLVDRSIEPLLRSIAAFSERPWRFGWCESEIERVFMAAWMRLGVCGRIAGPTTSHPIAWFKTGYAIRINANPVPRNLDDLLSPTQLADNDQIDLTLIQPSLLQYRPDFMIARRFTGIHDRLIFPPVWSPRLIIECDGHEFHERTKEQAQRDKKRDRDLTAAGYRVMRFTGSELWRDPWKCACEVETCLNAMSLEALTEARAKEG